MTGSLGAVERLEFTLPDFTRHSWAGDAARAVWEPRLERIRRAWLDVEWLSVVDGIRACALIGMPHSLLPTTTPRWSAHRLSAVGLPMSPPDSHPGLVFAAVGSLEHVTILREAWLARADELIGRLLGYPDCCRAFFQQVWVEHRATDTTWGMATHTTAADGAVVAIEPGDSHLANILWRWLGVRAVPHLPCRFDCRATIELGERLLGVATRAGFTDEVAWINEILSWPVEWSALHGIAEIKTPILKISTRTDATANKYVVRRQGTNYPVEGATGLRFPYQAPSRPLLTEGRSFQLGLKRPADRHVPVPAAAPAPEPERSWYFRDNGFSSLDAMTALHAPIVARARARLDGTTGHVLDLGCGNGALLAKICDGQRGLTPHGVDRNAVALEHARVLLPGLAGNFAAADLFDVQAWSGVPRYALTVLMLGRLLEVDRAVATRLLDTLRVTSDAVLVYAYPDQQSLAEIARQLGLELVDADADANLAFLRLDVIDWTRLAEPQADQYDTDTISRLAATTVSVARPQRYQRTPVGDSPSIFDGAVAIRHVCHSVPEFAAMSAHYLDAPADHINLRIAAGYIRCWPAAYAQCQRLLEAIHPAVDTRIPFESAEIYRGSSCHSYEQLFGTLWATIFCPIGLAEAIVHELAHQKLRVLGVAFESATAIVGNDPAARYVSPIVKDRERPMTAVLHAQYSYVHVTALDLHLLSAERDPARRATLAVVLERNLARIEEGHETLHRHFEPGEHGREFMAGFTRWTEATIAAAKELLGRGRTDSRLAPTIAAGPLPDLDTRARIIRTPDREIEVISTFASPRIVVLGNVLDAEECDALIAYCEPRLERSPVVADADGNVRIHDNRTSRSASLRRAETALVARVEARLSALASWPIDHAEGLEVLRYEVSHEYRPHFDYFDPDVPGLRKHLESGGQRLATFILYLSDVEAGGETSFPDLGLDIVPRKGGAVFFVNTDARHLPDKRTLHAGRPVVRGVKLVANKWLRQRAC